MATKITQIEYRPLSKLKKHPRNPRLIKDKSFQTLVDSVEANPDYFEARPIILSDRTGDLIIIAGNQRYAAAKQLGFKEVPTVLLPALTEEKEQEIMIRDNVANGEWDFDMLAQGWDSDLLNEWGLSVPDWGENAEFSDDFDLPDGDREPFQQKTFTFADQQAEIIDEAISLAKQDLNCETFGNENSNGNALFKVVSEWYQQNK